MRNLDFCYKHCQYNWFLSRPKWNKIKLKKGNWLFVEEAFRGPTGSLRRFKHRMKSTTTKVQSYFSLKSRCSTLFTANVVYLFSCPCDKSVSYVGETRRQLFRRILEHGKMGTNSAVFEHLEGCDACQDKNIAESFTILQRCGSANICSVEAMFINKLRPSLNTQLGPSKGAAVSLSLYKWCHLCHYRLLRLVTFDVCDFFLFLFFHAGFLIMSRPQSAYIYADCFHV